MPILSPTLPARWLITASGIDTADDPDIFPYLSGQSFLANKFPKWSTDVKTAVSGVERRRALWSYPIWQFKFGYEILRSDAAFLELQRLVSFFNSKSGSTQGFWYYDRYDHAVSACQFGVGDGSTVTFQLKRIGSVGSIKYTEPVFGVQGTPTIYVNGVATSVTFGAFGMVTFASPPADEAVLSWTGNFFFLCRFEKDSLDGLGQINGTMWDLSDLGFLSYKP